MVFNQPVQNDVPIPVLVTIGASFITRVLAVFMFF